MKTRRGKTVAQQCRYYEVDNIYEYMVSVYINGNISAYKELYKELNEDARKEFASYCFSEVNPHYLEELILSII
jgi:glucosamine 6-phosphate synthetase-like amidotransferase/phosphosugar isomerase protein